MAKQGMKPDFKHSLKLAGLFAAAWIVAGVVTLAIGGYVSIILLVLNMFTLLVPVVLERLTNTKVPTVLQINYLAFITASSLLGSALNWYGIFLNWDTLVHIYSGTMLAWFGVFAVRVVGERSNAKFPRWFTASVALATPLALASLWEIYEYMSDLYLNTTMQTGGLEDTIIDMIAALIGAAIAALLIVMWSAPRSIAPRS